MDTDLVPLGKDSDICTKFGFIFNPAFTILHMNLTDLRRFKKLMIDKKQKAYLIEMDL
jgi:hypothetical protein